VVKQNGLPLRVVILSKFTVVSSFEEWFVIGGWCRTVISIRKWFGQSFPKVDSFSLSWTVISAERMSQLGEWSRFSNQRLTFLGEDSFSLGCTVISAGGMVWAQKLGIFILLCLGRIVQIAHG
jgi:hypothetical protein